MRTSRCIAALALAAALHTPARAAHAQDTDRAAVFSTVQKVFDAMRTRDTHPGLLAHRAPGIVTRT
jgi:hypothetical protein